MVFFANDKQKSDWEIHEKFFENVKQCIERIGSPTILNKFEKYESYVRWKGKDGMEKYGGRSMLRILGVGGRI